MAHSLHPLLESGILLTAIAAVLLNLFFNGAQGDTAGAVEAAKAAEAHRWHPRKRPSPLPSRGNASDRRPDPAAFARFSRLAAVGVRFIAMSTLLIRDAHLLVTMDAQRREIAGGAVSPATA